MTRSHRSEAVRLAQVGLVLMVLSASCQLEQPESSAELGSVAIELSSVPPDVHCIRIDVQGAARSLSQEFGVTPGGEAVLMLSGLPLGQLAFSGAAFAATCDAVDAADSGEWSSDSVVVELVAGQAARVSLVMKRSGHATVDVSFEDDATCAPGAQNCNGLCVNTANDPAHCGACAVACMSGTACISGACVCPAGLNACAGICVPIDDPQNCGGCGRVCTSDQRCSAGRCMCAEPQVDCAGRCVDIDFDPRNCGACGRVCPPGRQICDGGACFAIAP